MKKPQSIHSILEKTLKDLEIDVSLKGYSIWGAWKEIVGNSVARQTQPRAIRNRILFIDVSHSTWIQQLQFLKPKLLEKLNDFLGESPIQDIRFKLGKVSSPPPIPSKISHWREEVLDEETLQQMESHLQNIEHDEVKRGLRDILIKGAKLERSRKKAK
jgi:predicted nucleic acid-binding Zn ribbon protein